MLTGIGTIQSNVLSSPTLFPLLERLSPMTNGTILDLALFSSRRNKSALQRGRTIPRGDAERRRIAAAILARPSLHLRDLSDGDIFWFSDDPCHMWEYRGNGWYSHVHRYDGGPWHEAENLEVERKV